MSPQALRRATKQVYKPGDFAPVSGLYLATHSSHREPHKAILIRAEEFPPCRTCGTPVAFTVAQQVSHITNDWDFAGTSLMLVKK